MNHNREYPGPTFTIKVANLSDEMVRDYARVIMQQASYLIWESLVVEEMAVRA